MNHIQAQLFLMFLGASPRERNGVSVKASIPEVSQEQVTRRRAFAKRLVDAREREMQLFDEGHSHESARAIVRGEQLNSDKMYNDDMRAGVLI